MRLLGALCGSMTALAFLVGSGEARSETINCIAITNALVPYTIASPGVYCVTEKITTNLSTGAAITINANNVVLDLNDFAIGNLGAGTSTTAVGVMAVDRQNIVVKNGIMRGFWVGVALLDGTSIGLTTALSSGHLVDHVTSDHSYLMGITVQGPDCTVSNSRVLATQGSAMVNPLAPAQVNKSIGIDVGHGGNAHVTNNAVFDTDCINGCTATTASTGGIVVTNAADSVVESNVVMNVSKSSITTSFGILVDALSPNTVVKANTVSSAALGIFYTTTTGANGKYLLNVTQNTTVPYSGGTAIFSNF